MARTAFDPATMLQVFRGSKQPLGVFAKHAGSGCCGTSFSVGFDRLADVVHGPNSHTHLNPVSYNDKYMVPMGPVGGTLENDRDEIVSFINAVGVGAKIGIICIPNFAFVTDISVRIEAEEPGLTFNLKTRNELALPSKKVITVKTTRSEDNVCVLERDATEKSAVVTGNLTSGKVTGNLTSNAVSGTVSDTTVTATVTNTAVTGTVTDTTISGKVTPDSTAANAFNGFGKMDDNVFIDIFGRDGDGVFTAEADEIMLEVASMPVGKKVVGNFRVVVAVNYSICDRAERE